MITKYAFHTLAAVCALRVYRGPDMRPWIDDGQGMGTNWPQTIGECVGYAIIEGTMLADGIVKMWVGK